MNEDKVFDIIVKNLLEILPFQKASNITLHQSMKDLGANSIDRADILLSTMETLDVKFPLHEAANLKNIGELVHFLNEKVS